MPLSSAHSSALRCMAAQEEDKTFVASIAESLSIVLAAALIEYTKYSGKSFSSPSGYSAVSKLMSATKSSRPIT